MVDKLFKDVVPDYADYLNRQTGKYFSHEKDNTHWERGQQRYIADKLTHLNKDSKILDIACGDGVGLRVFKKLGFTNVTGVEYCDKKLTFAADTGYPVHKVDMHNLAIFSDGSFDVVYSSHTLEHAYSPTIVIKEFKRVLKPSGLLYVVLPFPDNGPEDAHGGKFELNTHQNNPLSVCSVFENCGFSLISMHTDQYREPEIWLDFIKNY